MRLPKLGKKLRTQIAVHYLIASALTLLVVGVVLYAGISSVVLGEADDSAESAVDRSGMYIDLYIDRLHAVSSLLAESPQVVSYLSDAERDPDVRADILATIDTLTATDSFIESVLIVSQDGQILSNENDLTMNLSDDMMAEPWYLSAIQEDSMPELTSARMQDFSMDSETWVVSLSREIENADGENIGVLLIDIDYEAIKDYLADFSLGEDGFFFILNDDGEVVYHEDTSYFSDPAKQARLQEIIAEQATYDTDENTLTHTYELQNADWLLAGVASQDSLLMIRRQLIETFLLVGLVLLAIAAASIYGFAGRITAPFRKLERAMQEVETGLNQVAIDERGCYEAQSLARHFNAMTVKIDRLMQEVVEKEKHLRTSEIEALHSQINPHFLYNTLDTIVWMAEFNDSEKVIDMTKALARFFRLSLSGGSELTTIEHELDHVRQYLFIQKERYGEQLAYNISCDPALKEIRIPKILLQPLVENALYHGIRGKKQQGSIEVSASQQGDEISLTVNDNGTGFDVSQMASGKSDESGALDGIGIENVDRRVKLYYGEEYGVTIESEIGGGTTAIVKVASQIKS